MTFTIQGLCLGEIYSKALWFMDKLGRKYRLVDMLVGFEEMHAMTMATLSENLLMYNPETI